MSTKEEVLFLVLILAIVGGCLGLGHCVGYHQGERAQQRQAIETGHAHRVIIDSLTGATEFRWRGHGKE